MAEKVRRNTLLGVKLTPDEREAVEAQAQASGLSLSDFARRRLLPEDEAPPVAVLEPEPAAAPRTWAQEWAEIAKMDPAEAVARFRVLANGRGIPAGFPSWPTAQKVEWLERNWPLCQ
jgi:hypothetical protein